MKKLFGLIVLLALSVVLTYGVYAQDGWHCTEGIHGNKVLYACFHTSGSEQERPEFVPDDAVKIVSVVKERYTTIFRWARPYIPSPLPSPIQSPVQSPIIEKSLEQVELVVPQSGYVNGVWVPVYGLPCDQVYAMGNADCMCFYEQEQWCN